VFRVNEIRSLHCINFMMEILGYLAAVLIGISLGMIGGGGSILTVPALVYLMGTAPVDATAYSLFIVGATALVGAFQKYRDGLIHMKAAIFFGIPSILAVFLTRAFVMPAIPEVIGTFAGFSISKDLFIMLVFAILMVIASITMIRGSKNETASDVNVKHTFNLPLIFLEGALVGMLTGFVGAGGGFLIIPALVLLAKLPMKTAIGTSLLIIAAKSLIGFTGDIVHLKIDWTLLGIFTSLAVAGIFLGNRLGHKTNDQQLKKAFGWFVLIMGIYIIYRELLVHS
jgi:uncharacterized protein